MKHTSGPWKLAGSKHEERIVNDCCAVVCYLSKTGPQNAADARLIAAAPDLLEALQKITSMGSNTDPWPVETEMRKIARAAIAKATGDA